MITDIRSEQRARLTHKTRAGWLRLILLRCASANYFYALTLPVGSGAAPCSAQFLGIGSGHPGSRTELAVKLGDGKFGECEGDSGITSACLYRDFDRPLRRHNHMAAPALAGCIPLQSVEIAWIDLFLLRSSRRRTGVHLIDRRNNPLTPTPRQASTGQPRYPECTLSTRQ